MLLITLTGVGERGIGVDYFLKRWCVMDTSETYIKMRLATIPDLGLGNSILNRLNLSHIGDSVWVDSKGDWYYYTNVTRDDNTDVVVCQLERQDQLQKMVERDCPLALLNDFYRWINLTDIAGFDDSMEQLWLAFVMKELYQKNWDGKEWK